MSAGVITVVNPYSGQRVGEAPRGGAEEIEAAVVTAQEGARIMRDMPLHERHKILNRAAELLHQQVESLASLITAESGKTITEAKAEVIRAAGIFSLAAEEARRVHGETLPFDALANGDGRSGYWIREPVGIVGAITPWNVPLALAAHKIAPALAAGNAVIFKPAEQTPLNGVQLAALLMDAGLPDKALSVVTGYGEDAGDALVHHAGVPFISFTGSREVGMRLPGRAGYKRVALELGGNSPVIVTPSADLEAATADIVRGGFAVAGQLCISVQRIIAHESVAGRLAESVSARVAALRLGDPADPATDVGTLINAEACDRVAALVDAARSAGARILTGGERIGSAAYAPTVIDRLPPGSPLAQDEAFAPLVVITPYGAIEQAVAMANATPYGLNAGIYTNDLKEALYAAREIVAGSVMINDIPTFRSDLMPYGGRKQSGLGREGVRFAMEEMSEMKVVCFRQA